MVKLPVRSNGWGLKTGLTGGVHQSVTERGISGYRFGIAFWAAGYFSDLGRFGSPGSFYIFFFLAFLFLVSLIFCIFCKYASKPLKPLSEIF
jgi:hypothetical protein